MNCTFIAHCRS